MVGSGSNTVPLFQLQAANRLPADEPLDFARRSRVLLLTHTESAIDIDVILGGLPFEQTAVDHGRTHDVGGVQVKLPKVEDLLVMKAIAHRPKDLQDAEGLLDAHPDVNVEAVRRQVLDFANAVTMFDLVEDFDKILERHRAKQRRNLAPKE